MCVAVLPSVLQTMLSKLNLYSFVVGQLEHSASQNAARADLVFFPYNLLYPSPSSPRSPVYKGP